MPQYTLDPHESQSSAVYTIHETPAHAYGTAVALAGLFRGAEEARELSQPEFIVYGAYVSYAYNGDRLAWPSQATLERDLPLSRRTIQRAIKSLVERGLLTPVDVPARSQAYKVAVPQGRQSDAIGRQSDATEGRQSDAMGRQSDAGTSVSVTPMGRQSDARRENRRENMKTHKGAHAGAAHEFGVARELLFRVTENMRPEHRPQGEGEIVQNCVHVVKLLRTFDAFDDSDRTRLAQAILEAYKEYMARDDAKPYKDVGTIARRARDIYVGREEQQELVIEAGRVRVYRPPAKETK